MDGIHDLGGKHGYGPVIREADEPAFHRRWEAAVFAMMIAAREAGAFNNADRFRHSIERIDPVAYLTHGYYGRWLGGIETLLVEAGMVTTEEITRRALASGADERDLVAARPAAIPDPQANVTRSPRAIRAVAYEPRFGIGDAVVTGTEVKAGHTRLPAYARGKRGRIHHCHGSWVYPDNSAHGKGEDPRYLYTVAFAGRELWGQSADPAVTVYLDLFEPYLETQHDRP